MNEFERKLKDALDEKTAGLDASTLSRLRQAREQALDTPIPWWRTLHAGATVNLGGVLGRHAAPAAAALGLLVLVSLLMLSSLSNNNRMAENSDLELLEIISMDADVELVEDLDFYHWLEEQASQDMNQ